MIISFRHKGLKVFFETGNKSGIQPKHAAKLKVLLTVLNAAKGPNDIGAARWRLHPLSGELGGHYAVTVEGNWRLTFTFVDENVNVVDYLDYH